MDKGKDSVFLKNLRQNSDLHVYYPVKFNLVFKKLYGKALP